MLWFPFDFKGAWKAMEECQRLGLAKAIGVSNFTTKHLEKLFAVATISPAVNQVSQFVHFSWFFNKVSTINLLIDSMFVDLYVRLSVRGAEPSLAPEEAEGGLCREGHPCHGLLASGRAVVTRGKCGAEFRGAGRDRDGQRRECRAGCIEMSL